VPGRPPSIAMRPQAMGARRKVSEVPLSMYEEPVSRAGSQHVEPPIRLHGPPLA
jgi:hypothetical protein